jgi:hypothetical protein
VIEIENLNPTQKESLNSELQIISMIFLVNSNSQKYFIFLTQVGKKLGTLFSNQNQRKNIKTIANYKPKPTERVAPVKHFLYSHIARLHTLDFQDVHIS